MLEPGRKKMTKWSQFGEEKINKNGERLISFCDHMNLKILNSFYQHKDIHKFTWIQPTRRLLSIIDYCICKQNSGIKTTDVRVFRGAECGSDHHLVKASLLFTFKGRQLPHGNSSSEILQEISIRHYNLQSFENESTQFLYRLRLNLKLNDVCYSSAVNTYREIIRAVDEAAVEAVGEVGRGRTRNVWWNDDIESLVKQKKEMYNKWLATRDVHDRRRYNILKNEVKRNVNKAKNDLRNKACENADIYLGGTRTKEAWRIIKGSRTDNKERSRVNLIPPEKSLEYYEKIGKNFGFLTTRGMTFH